VPTRSEVEEKSPFFSLIFLISQQYDGTLGTNGSCDTKLHENIAVQSGHIEDQCIGELNVAPNVCVNRARLGDLVPADALDSCTNAGADSIAGRLNILRESVGALSGLERASKEADEMRLILARQLRDGL